MGDRSRKPLDPTARPPAHDHRLGNTLDNQDAGRVRRPETPIGDDDVSDAEDTGDYEPSSFTLSELDMPVQSHWGNVRPAPKEIVRNVVRGSLITVPLIQFAKDRDGKRKREQGFFKSPFGMMLIKSDKNNRGDAPNDPLVIQRTYNSKPIAANAYLEFRSICAVELNEYVELDGQLEMESWVRLFKLYMSTVSRTATQQLQRTPVFRRQIRDVFDNLTRGLDEDEERAASAVSTGPIQRTTSDEATPQTQQFPATTGKKRKCDVHENAQRRRHDVDVVDLRME
ncbi:unnamed protein product [Alternaria alternata]